MYMNQLMMIDRINKDYNFRDNSPIYSSIIDHNFVINKNGYDVSKVRIRSERIPIIGSPFLQMTNK